MSTQKITSGSVTYFVCECGNPPQYCKCSELARIAHSRTAGREAGESAGVAKGVEWAVVWLP